EHLSHSQQPLVPERVFVTNGEPGASATGGATGGLLGTLISLLVAEKSGFQLTDANGHGMGSLQDFANTMTKEAMASMQQAASACSQSDSSSSRTVSSHSTS